MELADFQEAIGLASSAVGLTSKAASTVEEVKRLFSAKKGDPKEAEALLNTLAIQLTSANMMNLDLSAQLKVISAAVQAENTFEERKRRYRLVDTGMGEMILELRPEDAGGDPPHYVCPVCLEKERRFHFVTGPGTQDGKYCQNCKHFYRFRPANFHIPPRRPMSTP